MNRYRSTDEDDEDNDSNVVPFQVAYAVSVHKAQGLEYDSVKIVITNETEERITYNIFYTAITHAKKDVIAFIIAMKRDENDSPTEGLVAEDAIKDELRKILNAIQPIEV